MGPTLPRPAWALLLALSSLIAGGTRSCVSTARAEPAPLVQGVGCVGLTVSDLERAADFYTRVLAFEKVAEVEQVGEALEQLEGVFGARTRTVRLRLGRECLELTEYLAPRGRPVPPDARSNDRWFQHVAIVVSDMDRAYAALRAGRVEHASTGPQRLPDWNPNAGGIRAFYFRDPDRHVLEVLQFPPDKGEPRWHEKGALFAGIDHTAIVVGDTDASVRFYRDALGLRIAGTSENWGTEQEHLNNVFGARLRITTLRGTRGPGIELLEYLVPRDGRAFPSDERANDLIHWQTTLFAPDLGGVASALRNLHATFVSPGIVTVAGRPLGWSRAVLARDPDGHVLQLAAE
jgi:catechol 2,3-dioxygenase-like lactoylglutathione lyase family enzyme